MAAFTHLYHSGSLLRSASREHSLRVEKNSDQFLVRSLPYSRSPRLATAVPRPWNRLRPAFFLGNVMSRCGVVERVNLGCQRPGKEPGKELPAAWLGAGGLRRLL